MKSIKIVGAIIAVLLVISAIFSNTVARHHESNLRLLKSLNRQKAFTQEISKQIFYLYKNRDRSTQRLDSIVKEFVETMNEREEKDIVIDNADIAVQNKKILTLWNDYYRLVQKFRDTNRVNNNSYTSLYLETLIKNIYDTNRKLIAELNKLIDLFKEHFSEQRRFETEIQFALFAFIGILLLYLFSRMRELMKFIQKFLHTSRSIARRATVKGVAPIETPKSVDELSEATNAFNALVRNIDDSIEYADKSLAHGVASLERIEQQIENLLDLIEEMDEQNDFDKELIKKEDILIESLDELTLSAHRLHKLKERLQEFSKKPPMI